MELCDSLRKEIYDHIDQIEGWDHSHFGKEEDFIDEAVDTLDDFDEGIDGQSLQMKAKKMHPSPKVDFPGPSWDSSTQARKAATWIENKQAELADILLIVNRFRGGTVEERRVSLSQTKFSKQSSSSPMKWTVKMHQYHLLYEFPEIEFVEPSTGEKFDYDPERKSFATYSFASDFDHGFFNTTEKMRDFMSSTEGVKSTIYDPTPDAPYGFQVFRGILKRALLGMYGEPFEAGDELSQMIRHMFEESTFERSDSQNQLAEGSDSALSDGGEVEEDSGTAVIQIDVGLENQETNFDEIDPEGPRL
jgi:hypothetical protein